MSKANIIPAPKTGQIVESQAFKKYGLGHITKTVTLQELVNMKNEVVEKIKSLYASLSGMNAVDLKLETIKEIVIKITAHQYNLCIIKEMIAICNVGLPFDDMPGINGCIFHSADIKALNTALSNVSSRTISESNREDNRYKEIRSFVRECVDKNKETLKIYTNTQKEYNKKMKVNIELLMIK